MSFIKTPVKGMQEQLPQDMAVREYALRKIKDTYKKFGFTQISTPFIEHIENLTGKQGGENEQLIFKILKRGEKLEHAKSVEDMCDSGLRYDLTVPLSRFYSNNSEILSMPFKALQIGDVFRADRPQKGRFRQFTQCDIDIFGDSSNLAEIELISATVNMLNELGIKQLKVRVNDREILKGMAQSCNFAEDKLDNIYIVLDKLDKIGLNGVKDSLISLGLDQSDVEKYVEYFANVEQNISCKQFLNQKCQGAIQDSIIDNLNNIISCVSHIVGEGCEVCFDPTLVRGMSYYTGPIFEIELPNYHLSVAGGGRYDKMVEKFCGKVTPACGFSIGFERIISIIKENNLLPVETEPKTAVLIAKDVTNEKIEKTIIRANELRKQGQNVLISPRNNNAKYQKEKLMELGYNNFVEIFNDKGEL